MDFYPDPDTYYENAHGDVPNIVHPGAVGVGLHCAGDHLLAEADGFLTTVRREL